MGRTYNIPSQLWSGHGTSQSFAMPSPLAAGAPLVVALQSSSWASDDPKVRVTLSVQHSADSGATWQPVVSVSGAPASPVPSVRLADASSYAGGLVRLLVSVASGSVAASLSFGASLVIG